VTQQNQIQRKKLIFKALVMGYNLELQAGFLSRASSVPPAFQLYSALGLGLGVARVEQDDEFEVAIQLWSLPLIERCEGITNSFVRGHRAVIAVLAPDDIPRLPEILDSVPVESYRNLMIVIITEDQCSDTLQDELRTILGYRIDLQSISSVQIAMSILANSIIHDREEPLPSALQITPSACPTLRPVMVTSSTPLNTEQEVKFICDLAFEFGFETSTTSCIVHLKEGIAEIDLLSGSVSFKPNICTFCEKSCKRNTNICIVRKEFGWSNIKLGNRALLTIAKIYALANRELPEHVDKQIARTTVCQNFTLLPNLFEDKKLLSELIELGYIQQFGKWTLLEEAEKRVKNGQLSQDAYKIIRSMLERVRSSSNNNE
jgi:hypothetical protein